MDNELISEATRLKSDHLEALLYLRKTKPLQGLSVLLAEDADEIQIIYSRMLSSMGAHVDIAAHGLEAVRKARSQSYDLIIMDIQMPKMDGYEATRLIRRQGFDQPIFAVTASAFKATAQKSLENGCTAHFNKPVNFEQLVHTIKRYARRQQHR